MRVDINDISQLQAVLDENGLPDKIVPTKTSIELYYPDGGGCPTITLSDLSQSVTFVGNEDGIYTTISGGQGPYTPVVESGVIPDGYTPVSVEISPGVWAMGFAGHATTFGIFNFTLGGTDDNGCAITSRAFTITVKAAFEGVATPFAATGSTTLIFNTISDLPISLGAGVAIDSVSFNGSLSNPNNFNQTLLCSFSDINESAFIVWWQSPTVPSGQSFVDTTFTPDSVAILTDGSAPYTGNFSDNQTGSGFSSLDGVDPNQGFYVVINDDGTIDSGGITSGTIIFKPLP